MKSQLGLRSVWMSFLIFVLLFITGCSSNTSAPSPTASAEPTATATAAPTRTAAPEATVTSAPVVDKNILYQDDFTNPASGWPEEKFDNYFVGYHEPEYYHVEITSPNYKTSVYEPEKKNYGDVTIEVSAFDVSAKTSETGDFIYGPAFRRSGDEYYAFTISPRAKKWYMLKSTPNALIVLDQGTDDSIHDVDGEDALRVDAQGPNFTLHINDRVVGQVTDSDYSTGEIGFYAQTFDATNIHVHFDSLVIRNLESPSAQGGQVVLYQDDFTNPASGWPEKKFDNYFIGYHEPEYYHVEITSPNYRTTVFEPQKQSYGDVTIKVNVFDVSAKTSETGDFIYGPAFRRSGDDYYAFAVSPRTKKWYVLKSTPNATTILTEGTNSTIHDVDGEDALRVDAQGQNFSFYINDQLVGQVSDPDYTTGEIGFYAQTFDATNIHVHFDSLAIDQLEVSVVCTINAMALNIRSGPGTDYASSAFLTRDDVIQPLGKSDDGKWIKIGVAGSGEQGWVFNSKEFVSCTGPVDLLPVSPP